MGWRGPNKSGTFASMKPHLLITQSMPAETHAELCSEFHCHTLGAGSSADSLGEIASAIRGIASFGAVSKELMSRLPALEIVSNFGVGVDGIDLPYARERGIVVTNAPDVLNECVADTAIALTLMLLRRLPAAQDYLRAGYWITRGSFPYATSLGGKTMGILGLGRIGEAVARRATACGMRIRYHNRHPKPVPYAYDPNPRMLAVNSDVLMVVTPGGIGTRNLVNAAVLEGLGENGYLINISRGSVVDEVALIAFLRARRIAGAGLDVYPDEPRIASELLELDNTVLLPHVASATVETRRAMGRLMIENLRRYFVGQEVLTPVTDA